MKVVRKPAFCMMLLGSTISASRRFFGPVGNRRWIRGWRGRTRLRVALFTCLAWVPSISAGAEVAAFKTMNLEIVTRKPSGDTGKMRYIIEKNGATFNVVENPDVRGAAYFRCGLNAQIATHFQSSAGFLPSQIFCAYSLWGDKVLLNYQTTSYHPAMGKGGYLSINGMLHISIGNGRCDVTNYQFRDKRVSGWTRKNDPRVDGDYLTTFRSGTCNLN
jgi:hypothetical protein